MSIPTAQSVRERSKERDHRPKFLIVQSLYKLRGELEDKKVGQDEKIKVRVGTEKLLFSGVSRVNEIHTVHRER